MFFLVANCCRMRNALWVTCLSLLVLFTLDSCEVLAADGREIFMVLMEGDPVVVAFQGTVGTEVSQRRKVDVTSGKTKAYVKHLVESHDQLLESTLEMGSYRKLYSYHHLINGFALHTSPEQAEKLRNAKGVRHVEKDRGVRLMTTYTPKYLGLPGGPWTANGGVQNAGEDIVIGFVDTGINPTHPSFHNKSFPPLPYFTGKCDVGPYFPPGSCNGKIVSARYFAAGAMALVPINKSRDILSPFDATGHGSHTASTAAGNSGVQVILNGFNYGTASGMAPRARIAVYKAIYPDVGAVADVVAAIDQATQDGVDILSLSIGPAMPPKGTATFLNVFDIALLFAQRAGIFVVQAAGNSGPDASSILSFSPWIMTVGASLIDRTYTNTLFLGNGQTVKGVGLSGPTPGNGLFLFRLVLSSDALKRTGHTPRTAPATYFEECQYPEALNKSVVEGSLLICRFSSGFFNMRSEISAIQETAKRLSALGFILLANPAYGDFVAEPVPFSIAGIMIPKIADSKVVMDYYNSQTHRSPEGAVVRYGAEAAIGDGRNASFNQEAPMVTWFSSRGPDIINSDQEAADVMKPDIIAPGYLIWAAWSPYSIVDSILTGYKFALVSGTSMATPHIAGIAALIKQVNPSWSPAMIASAMITTASKTDNKGKPIMAQGSNMIASAMIITASRTENKGKPIMAQGSGSSISQLTPATPFDYGGGFINATAALDPGLVFQAEFEDYMSFLCSLPNVNPEAVKEATGQNCTDTLQWPSDLNLPSITVSRLIGSRTVKRIVTNVGETMEYFEACIVSPRGVEVRVSPSTFIIESGESQEVNIELSVSEAINIFSFGEIVFRGSENHAVGMPLSVLPVSSFP